MEHDERFKNALSDPKFRRVPQRDRKVKIDKRFQSMFKDSRFKVKSSVDKRGRPVSFASSENFRRYYDLSSEDSTSESDGEEIKDKKPGARKSKKEKVTKEKSGSSESESDELVEKDNKNQLDKDEDNSDHSFEGDVPEAVDAEEAAQVSANVREKLKDLSVDYARGGGCLNSDSSSSSESESEEGNEDEDIEHDWGELDKDAERTDESTARIAVCNMDWDRVRSEDLMVLLSSFLPAGGVILKVTVYPSDFGLKHMKEEEIEGPKELAEQKPLEEESGEDHFDVEYLRKYELRRLRYYYAVVECDSVATASHIYSECDGMEYESTSAKLDLRFIPDDTTFDHKPRDECTKLPDQNKYRPQFFKTSALSQAKFELSWDTTDPRRVELSHRVWATKDKEVDDDDLKAVLASSSGSESEGEQGTDDTAAKYRALLEGLDDGKNKGEELEVTWEVGLEAQAEKKAAEKKRKDAGLGEKTPFEEMMAKKRERLKEKRLQKFKKKQEAEKRESEDDGEAAFSDDELPPDLADLKDELMAEEGKKKSKGKKKNKKKADTEEMDPMKRAELELLMMDEDEDEARHFNLDTRKIKSQKKKREIEQKDDGFQVDVTDPRFAALYTSHHYNVDPADPRFKATPGTHAFVSEKLRRRQETSEHDNAPVMHGKEKKEKGKKKVQDPELSLLIKNVKRKTEQSLGAVSKKKRR